MNTLTPAEKRKKTWINIKKNKIAYLFLLPAVLSFIIFNYIPMPGMLLAFMDYDIFLGFKSPWVGFLNIKRLFEIPEFTQSILNTLKISLLNKAINDPLVIIFALMMNELKNGLFKRFTQTVSYLPHFLSTIAVVGIATSVMSYYGMLNDLRIWMDADAQRVLWLTKQELFIPIIIFLGGWKGLGWGSIVYLATLSGIDPSLYEAAIIDGAGKARQCWHITLPGLSRVIIMCFIMGIGHLFSSNFDLIYSLQNPYIDFEVISTVIYKKGITQGNYHMSTALGFVQGMISMVLVLGTNKISKKINDVSIL